MHQEVMVEALMALVEKKDSEIKELLQENEYYFDLWTGMLDGIYGIGGRAVIDQAIAGLNDVTKARLQRYLNENFGATEK